MSLNKKDMTTKLEEHYATAHGMRFMCEIKGKSINMVISLAKKQRFQRIGRSYLEKLIINRNLYKITSQFTTDSGCAVNVWGG